MTIVRSLYLPMMFLVISGSALTKVPKCVQKVKGSKIDPTTAQRMACLVTDNFYERHLASTIDEAKESTVNIQRSSTFIPVTTSNFEKLAGVSERQGRRGPKTLSTWFCTYDSAGKSATCATENQDLYFCVVTKRSGNKIVHLDDNPNGECREK